VTAAIEKTVKLTLHIQRNIQNTNVNYLYSITFRQRNAIIFKRKTENM